MKRPEKLKWYAKEFEIIKDEIRNKDNLSHYDFLRIRNFKLQNLSTENERRIKEITIRAFNLAKEDNIKGAINELLELNGVAIPIASTILAMKFPDKYAIIDKRVIRALEKEEWLRDYLTNPETYEKYLILFRKMAKMERKSLRELERSLFEK